MPRKWTNSSGGGGGSVNHKFVPATPVRTEGRDGPLNLYEVEQILTRNAKIAGRREDRPQRRR